MALQKIQATVPNRFMTYAPTQAYSLRNGFPVLLE